MLDPMYLVIPKRSSNRSAAALRVLSLIATHIAADKRETNHVFMCAALLPRARSSCAAQCTHPSFTHADAGQVLQKQVRREVAQGHDALHSPRLRLHDDEPSHACKNNTRNLITALDAGTER